MGTTQRLLMAISIGVLAISLLSNDVSSADKVVAWSAEDCHGAWIGWTGATIEHLRLDLDSDGTGLFAYMLVSREPVLYDVTHWQFNDGTISLDVRPVDRGESIEVLGQRTSDGITVAVSGKNWNREVVLISKEIVDAGQQKIQAAIEKLKSNE